MTSKVLGKEVVRCDVPFDTIRSWSHSRRLLFTLMNAFCLQKSVKNPLNWTIRGMLLAPLSILLMLLVLCYTPREAWKLKNKYKEHVDGVLYRCRVLVVKEWLDNE